MDEIVIKDKASLDMPIEELEQKLLTENNIDELNNIINIFNLHIKRKDIARTSKLNDLQDKITSQIADRLDRNAGEFSNKDLLDYFKVMQDTINKADNSLDTINTPAIQINQQQINVGTDVPKLNGESRAKVKDFVAKILADSAYTIEDYSDIVSGDISNLKEDEQ